MCLFCSFVSEIEGTPHAHGKCSVGVLSCDVFIFCQDEVEQFGRDRRSAIKKLCSVQYAGNDVLMVGRDYQKFMTTEQGQRPIDAAHVQMYNFV
jgi:hypothetical protein